jgi:hypothetical protein
MRARIFSVRSVRATALCLCVAGCAAPNRQYQGSGVVSISTGGPVDGVSPYRLCAIEFDEQGIPWNYQQRRAALSAVRQSGGRPLLIVFIHGWQHNASARDTDLVTFNRLLDRLTASGGLPGRTKVVGVFIGWRGLSGVRELDWTGIGWAARQFSFYSRKNKTDKIAGVGLTQTLYDLSSAARAEGGNVVFVGHSFGGRILEKAVAQALIGQTAGSAGGSTVMTPADLTLLINPASEALNARQLKIALQNWRGRTPPVVSLTSTNDLATGLAWPVATTLSTSIDPGFRKLNEGVNERTYVTNTSGHSPMIVDRVVEETVAPKEAVTRDAFGDAVRYNLKFGRIDAIRAGDKWWRIREIETSSGPIVMNGDQARGYWVMQIPPTIIKGHSGDFKKGGIFTDSAIELITGIFAICRPELNRRQVRLAPTTE